MNRLDNKVALITGGANGQGAVEAELFLEAGAKVVITDVDTDAGKAVAAKLGPDCEFIEQDVASEQDWTRVVEQIAGQHGRIDVLVNNAGLFRVLKLEETSLQAWNQLIAVNQTGVFLGMRSVAPMMKQHGSGSIINISSIAGLGAAPQAHAYSAAKWAVRGMSKSAALQYAADGVRVNSVHPGLIDTSMMDEFPIGRDKLVKRVPVGRLGEAIEVARVVLFLASDDASYCTGQEFTVDGGERS